MCSYVCQIADPSLTPNLKGFLLDGLAPRPRGKHLGLSFSGWSWAPDSRKHYFLEVPVACRPGEKMSSCESRASSSKKPCLFDDHIVPEARKGSPQLVQKATKKQNTKTQTFADLAIKLDFECLLEGFRCQKHRDCAPTFLKNSTVSQARPKMENCVSIVPARADRR